MNPTTIKRGASFMPVLDDRKGNAATALVSAVLKYARDGSAPGDDAPAAAIFQVTYQADIDRGDGTVGPGWFLSLDEADTLALVAGRTVVMDVRIEIDGIVQPTETHRMVVTERVTEGVNG